MTAPAASADHERVAAALARAVAVMDRLRSPGGCPWDHRQTHESLLPYAVEEAHELVEAVEHGDRGDVREELGDVLLQVLFHARIAAEHPDDPFDVADVADGLVAKLVRRHPHVFADGAASGSDAGDVHARWDRLKRAEKPARTSALDGVPATMGALARTQKLVARADRAGLPVPAAGASEDLGDALLALVAAAHRAGVDAEAALRQAATAWEESVRRLETGTQD